MNVSTFSGLLTGVSTFLELDGVQIQQSSPMALPAWPWSLQLGRMSIQGLYRHPCSGNFPPNFEVPTKLSRDALEYTTLQIHTHIHFWSFVSQYMTLANDDNSVYNFVLFYIISCFWPLVASVVLGEICPMSSIPQRLPEIALVLFMSLTESDWY